MTLRKYQSDTTEWVRRRERRGKFRACIESPTGSGKSWMIADLLQDCSRRLLLTHRRILLDQTSKVLMSFGVKHGFRASGYKPLDDAPIQLAMMQTEMRRVSKGGKLANVDMVLVDELHCQTGEKNRALLNDYHNADASIVGFSATPSDMLGIVDEVYRAATVPQLIEQGHLCPPRLFSCGQPDIAALEQLKRDAAGEFSAQEVNRLVRPNIIFGQVIKHYRRLNPDGRAFILFAHSVKSSIWWAQMLTHNGFPTAHIDGDSVWVDGQFFKSDSTKRRECFKRIENGDLSGLSNRFVLREGFDCSAIGHAIVTCPIGRRRTWVQMCGRVLRPHGDREYAIIQDHGGNIFHPRLDSDEPWDWAGPPGVAEKVRISSLRNNPVDIDDEESDAPREPIVCPKCNAVREIGKTCPYCGFFYPKHAHYVIQTDGTLRLVEGRAFKPRRVRPRPDDAQIWERLYWGAKKNKPNRTFEQIYAYYAYKTNWAWLPRDLPLQPKAEGDWFLPVGAVPIGRLR